MNISYLANRLENMSFSSMLKYVKKVSKKTNKPKIDRCYNCMAACNPSITPYCISQALINAVNGDIDNALVFCGANAYKIDKIQTVKQVIDELTCEIL
ncbi:MAG: hypothetical protein ACI4PU_07595 [Intestinibacter sp.]